MKSTCTRAMVCVFALLLASLSVFPQRTKTSPERLLRQADQDWLKVFEKKDNAASVAFCLADASVLAPNQPIATGHEGISKLFAGFFALPGLTISWQPTKTRIARSGDIGITSGLYKMSFGGPNGSTVNDTGKYVTVWKKQKGTWKVWLDIFNSDLLT